MKLKTFLCFTCFFFMLLTAFDVMAWHSVMERRVPLLLIICQYMENAIIVIGIVVAIFIVFKKISRWCLGVLGSLLLGCKSVTGIILFVTRRAGSGPEYDGYIYLGLFFLACFLFLVSSAKLAKNKKKDRRTV